MRTKIRDKEGECEFCKEIAARIGKKNNNEMTI